MVTRILRPEFITGGCVLDLKMDEGEGTVAHDTSGYGNHGTLYGPTWADGYCGKALSFDGVDDYVEVPGMLFSPKMTIEVWVKSTDTETRHYIYGSANTSGDGWGLENECHLSQLGGKYEFFCKTADVENFRVTGGIQDTEWHHIVGVMDDKAYLYLDGSLVNSVSITGNIDFSAYFNWLRIGRPTTSIRYMKGLIDEVRIYNRALTAEEIKAHWLGSRVPKVRQL